VECWYAAIKNTARVLVFCGDMQLPLCNIIFPQDQRVLVYCNKNTTRVLVFCGDMQLPLCNIIFPQDHRVLVYCNKNTARVLVFSLTLFDLVGK
jgi:hypothetical protein